MKQAAHALLIILFIANLSCSKQPPGPDPGDTTNQKMGILKGTVSAYEGSCFPVTSCEPIPHQATVHISRRSEDFYDETFVDSFPTAQDGSFEIPLPEGHYYMRVRNNGESLLNYWIEGGDLNTEGVDIYQDSTTYLDAYVDLRDGFLVGKVGLYEGNCMPGPGVLPCVPTPIATTIALTQPFEFYDPLLLADSIRSSDNGVFELWLPQGDYSIFMRDGEEFVCDRYVHSTVRYCHVINMASSQTTTVILNIDHASW